MSLSFNLWVYSRTFQKLVGLVCFPYRQDHNKSGWVAVRWLYMSLRVEWRHGRVAVSSRSETTTTSDQETSLSVHRTICDRQRTWRTSDDLVSRRRRQLFSRRFTVSNVHVLYPVNTPVGRQCCACLGQCNSSYGFPVTVRITVSNFCIFQLQLLLLLTYLTFSVTITVTDPVIKS